MKKLHLGCGWRNFGSDWIHIDGGKYDHLDHKDITKLEFESDTVDLIYASHVIEYFDRDEIKPVLQEWKRVLKIGGILRLAVPDFSKLITLYQITGKIDSILGPLFGKMEMGENKIYHKIVYDFNSLKTLLYELEFNNVKLYDWRDTDHANFDDHSQAYYPHMDKDNGILISLNVQCIK